MLKLNCPFCGVRDERDFRCGGQSHIVRPGPHDQVSDETWAEYLFMRDNPKGWHLERWQHIYGCRQWFNIARNTVTHEIRTIYSMTGEKPVIENISSKA